VYLPNPVIDKEKIQGQIIEQHSPPLRNAYIEIVPLVKIPIDIAVTPKILKIRRVRAGLSWLIKKATICIKTQMIYQ